MEYVWIRIHEKVASFEGADNVRVPQLLPGDVYKMTERDAKHLQDQGAGTIHTKAIPDRATFRRASDLNPLTNGMERETEAINKLDRGDDDAR